MIRGLYSLFASLFLYLFICQNIVAQSFITDHLFRERFGIQSDVRIEKSLQKAVQNGKQLKGSFGKLFKVFDPYTKKKVMVKISPLNDHIEWLTFYMESLALNELDHPNLLKGFGSYLVNLDDENQRIGIAHVMESLDEDLHRCITSKGPLETADIKKFIGPLVSALTYLSTNMLAHFDIKPENILVKYEEGSSRKIEKLALADFGGLRMLTPSQATVNQRQHGMSMTPNYAPKEAFFSVHPENMSGTSKLKPMELNEKTDVWSLGILLYVASRSEFLIDSRSQLPYMQLEEIKKDLLSSFDNRDGGYHWKQSQVEHFDPSLLSVIDKMLRFNPEDRISMEKVASSRFFSLEEEEPKLLSDRTRELFERWAELSTEDFKSYLLELGELWDQKMQSLTQDP